MRKLTAEQIARINAYNTAVQMDDNLPVPFVFKKQPLISKETLSEIWYEFWSISLSVTLAVLATGAVLTVIK